MENHLGDYTAALPKKVSVQSGDVKEIVLHFQLTGRLWEVAVPGAVDSISITGSMKATCDSV